MRNGAWLLPAAICACYGWSVPGAGSDGGDAGAPESGDASLESGLVAWWRFEEPAGATVVDSSGHNNDGTSFGGVGRSAGKIGSAATFNGQDAFIHVPDNGSLHFESGFTIAFWIDALSTPYDPRFLETFAVWQVKLNTRRPQLRIIDTGGQDDLQAEVTIGQWHHVAFTYDGGVVVGYVDGTASAFADTHSIGPAPNSTKTSGGVNIGASFQASSPPATRTEQPYFASGALDEIRLYARVLAPAEIAALALAR